MASECAPRAVVLRPAGNAAAKGAAALDGGKRGQMRADLSCSAASQGRELLVCTGPEASASGMSSLMGGGRRWDVQRRRLWRQGLTSGSMAFRGVSSGMLAIGRRKGVGMLPLGEWSVSSTEWTRGGCEGGECCLYMRGERICA